MAVAIGVSQWGSKILYWAFFFLISTYQTARLPWRHIASTLLAISRRR